MAFSAMLTLSACSDFLDAENKSAGGQTADEYFSTPEGAASMRTAAYYSLKQIVTQADAYDDGTDIYRPCRGGRPVFQDYTFNAENPTIQTLYVSCMDLINYANGLIKYSGETYTAEASFLRAYGYYILTQQFGRVPLTTEYISSAETSYPRADLADIYKQMIEDLTTAANGLPSMSSLSTQKGAEVSKEAAQALLAKVYLAAGWDLGTTLTDATKGAYSVNDKTYFEQAVSMADQVLASKPIKMTFADKWSPAKEKDNAEIIFAVQYEREGNPYGEGNDGHMLQNYYGHYYGASTTNGNKYVNSSKTFTAKSLFLWNEGDERYDATFMREFYQSPTGKIDWTKNGYYAYYNASAAEKANLTYAYYYAPGYVSQADFEAYLKTNQAKFAKPNDAINTVHAYLMADPILEYYFNADGTFQQADPTGKDGPTSNPMKYDWVETIDDGTQRAPCVKKWDDPNTTLTNEKVGYRDIVTLHSSDICLVAAEAYAAMGNEAKALEYVNKVRIRAKATTISSVTQYENEVEYDVPVSFGSFTILDVVLDERARELYAEGQRWMTLRRTRQLVRYNIAYNDFINSVNDMSNAKGEVKWYRPIPQLELSSNVGMQLGTEDNGDIKFDQNPGY